MACVPNNEPKSVILSTQTQCDECRYGVQSMLRRVQGVYSVTVNADRNTITIAGNSAPKELLETLLKVSQDAEFCVKPPAHVSPSSCPANKTNCGSCLHARPPCSSRCIRQQHNNYGLRTCSNPPNATCCAAPPRCCACTGTGKAASCYAKGFF